MIRRGGGKKNTYLNYVFVSVAPEYVCIFLLAPAMSVYGLCLFLDHRCPMMKYVWKKRLAGGGPRSSASVLGGATAK